MSIYTWGIFQPWDMQLQTGCCQSVFRLADMYIHLQVHICSVQLPIHTCTCIYCTCHSLSMCTNLHVRMYKSDYFRCGSTKLGLWYSFWVKCLHFFPPLPQINTCMYIPSTCKHLEVHNPRIQISSNKHVPTLILHKEHIIIIAKSMCAHA